MTLYKQIALMTSIIITILLSSVMVINYQSAKNDMIQSLYETTVNNISTLTNKLAETADESALLVTIIDSEFDSGYFKMIKFESNDGQSDYEQVDNNKLEDVPQWFIDFANVEVEIVSADVSSGWNIIGTVYVQGDIGIVYKALYKTFIKLVYLFVIFLSITLIVLSILLRLVLKPLERIRKQAEAIMNDMFIIEKKVPYTTEFKDVAKGMNAMVQKVEDMFNKGNEAVKRNKELQYNDPVTKLYNRRYLMQKLPELIKEENKTDGGTIMFIALDGAEVINQEVGRQKADEIFFELANVFTSSCQHFESKVIARVNGTEFTLMIPDCEANEALEIADEINNIFNKLLSTHEIESKEVHIHIGIYRYRPSVSIGDLLTRADNALAHAKSSEDNNLYLYEEKDAINAMGKEQWRAIIEESIDKDYFSLKFWPTLNAKTKNVDHKVMTFTIDGGENKKYFYGDFIASAINLGLVSKMYIVTLRDLITKRHEELDGSVCSIRLSNEFIKDNKSFDELSSLFDEHAKALKFKLSFEVSDTFAINNTAAVKGFVDLFSKYGFGFGINSFTAEANDFTYLKQLNPKFLKTDASFLLDQSQDSMSSLQVITDSLGIEIVATFVKTEDELKRLQSMHIHSIQGPVTDLIK